MHVSKDPTRTSLIMAKTKKQKYNIVCLSNQLWDFPNWTNKRHVMQRLTKKGHSVIFVDPPINFGRLFLKQVFRGEWSLKRFLTRTKQDAGGAIVVSPINFLPISKLTSFRHVKKIKRALKKNIVSTRKTILWVYHVQLAELEVYVRKINHDILIYDCVDNYEAFPEVKSLFATSVYGEKLIEQEKKLTETANIVFASAPGLVEKLKKLNKNVYYTPNVGDYERFKNTKSYKYKIPKDLSEIPRPRIGMIGAMDEYKFDADLVRKCAQDNPNFSFVLIGPLALKDKNATIEDLGLADLDNVFYLGSRPYDQKKFYMAGFDVDIIPYQLNNYTVGGCFPVKFHDSLAAGLPVVVTDLPAYAPFGEVSYISKSYQEFSDNIRRALEEDNKNRIKQRKEVARVNSWDNKVEAMLDHIDNYVI